MHTHTKVKHIGDVFTEKSPKNCRVTRVFKQGEGEPLRGTLAERHGSLGELSWKDPTCTVKCNADARPGYNTKKVYHRQTHTHTNKHHKEKNYARVCLQILTHTHTNTYTHTHACRHTNTWKTMPS